jgi:hypothetical protein
VLFNLNGLEFSKNYLENYFLKVSQKNYRRQDQRDNKRLRAINIATGFF